MSSFKEIESNLEIEYKFWANKLSMEDFHTKVEQALGSKIVPYYVVSCDDYFLREGSEEFVRYRKGGGKTELTLKFKRKENTVRKEINLNVSDNDDMSIVEFLKLSGYTKGFSVFKEAWIYYADVKGAECDISYYTLSDGRSVIEIEATKYDTVTEGVNIINFWKDKLKLSDLERETRSLFEIFTDSRVC